VDCSRERGNGGGGIVKSVVVISFGSSSVERAHNLSNGVNLGSGEAEELSQTWDTDWEQLGPKGW
jgi:hypothetical protein